MDKIELRKQMRLMLLTDLATICKKLAENPAVPDDLREQARGFAEEFDSLEPFRGKGDLAAIAHGDKLIIQMARFLPSIVRVQTWT